MLNGLFAAFLFMLTLLYQLYNFEVWESEDAGAWINILDIALLFLQTILLLSAVIKVLCMVSQLQSKAIFQKEKLIVLHTIIFSLYVIFIASSTIALDVNVSTEDV